MFQLEHCLNRNLGGEENSEEANTGHQQPTVLPELQQLLVYIDFMTYLKTSDTHPSLSFYYNCDRRFTYFHIYVYSYLDNRCLDSGWRTLHLCCCRHVGDGTKVIHLAHRHGDRCWR